MPCMNTKMAVKGEILILKRSMVLKYDLVGSFKHCPHVPRKSLGLAAVCISLPWATREPQHSSAQSSSRATIVPTAKKAI